jgi:hypothetical protein
MVVPVASSAEVISKGTGLESTLKFKNDMTISIQKKKGSTSCENMFHYGYASSPQTPGPFVHAIIKESKESNNHVFPRTVKLLQKYKQGEATCNVDIIEGAVKSIGKDMAKNLHSQIPVPESDKALFDLDENVVGCYHTTCTIGTGFRKMSPLHMDKQSASVNWAG